jgi:hypothetical protein
VHKMEENCLNLSGTTLNRNFWVLGRVWRLAAYESASCTLLSTFPVVISVGWTTTSRSSRRGMWSCARVLEKICLLIII